MPSAFQPYTQVLPYRSVQRNYIEIFRQRESSCTGIVATLVAGARMKTPPSACKACTCRPAICIWVRVCAYMRNTQTHPHAHPHTRARRVFLSRRSESVPAGVHERVMQIFPHPAIRRSFFNAPFFSHVAEIWQGKRNKKTDKNVGVRVYIVAMTDAAACMSSVAHCCGRLALTIAFRAYAKDNNLRLGLSGIWDVYREILTQETIPAL